MEIQCYEWCKAHGLSLIEIRDTGFIYQNGNGEWWYMPFSEM